MSNMWTYDHPTTEGQLDLADFDVEARDGSIGTVDEATYDVDASYIVVDTGPWIFGRKVLLPAGVIEEIDLDNRRIVVNRTKDQIKDGPEYDPDKGFDQQQHRDEYDRYYGQM
jgi:hypothetical protein